MVEQNSNPSMKFSVIINALVQFNTSFSLRKSTIYSFMEHTYIYMTQSLCVSNECVYKRKQELFDVVGCAYKDKIIQLCGIENSLLLIQNTYRE